MSRARKARKFIYGVVVGFVVVIWGVPPADATWAVVGTDTETKEVGVAFASCLNPEIIGDPATPLIPVVFSPGVGGGVFTDTVDTSVEPEILALLAQGLSPDQVLNSIMATENESRAQGQYGVVTVDGASGVRSGSAIDGSEKNGSSYSVHGNGVAAGTVESAAGAFETAQRAEEPLDEVLVGALVAGADAGGDTTCGDQTALFSQVVIVGPEDTASEPGYLLTVVVDEGDGQNPVQILADEQQAGKQGLVDVGKASGRGILVYLFAMVLGLVMVASGVVVFKYGIGNRSARR